LSVSSTEQGTTKNSSIEKPTTMILFFPYNTDAPIYYWPITTVCMIVVNVLVFAWEVANPEAVGQFTLATGAGLHPIQWLTNNFLHADAMHLIGNMIFLWTFGIVVEGKLGPLKTLPVYLGIGIVESAFTQTVMLAGEPQHCLGASSIIYGFMVMCLIWAPENDVECLLIVWFLFFIRTAYFEVSVKIMVALFVGLDILFLILNGGQLSTAFLHTTGAVWGGIVGLVMLKRGWVDCEHWDIFSVWAGRHQMTDAERAKQDAKRPEARKQRAERRQKHHDLLLEGIHQSLQEGNPVPANVMYEKLKTTFPDTILPESDLLLLTQLLLEQGLVEESLNGMNDYLKHYTRKASLVRLNIGNILYTRNQPRSAWDVLKQIDPQTLDAAQTRYFNDLRERIAKLVR